jgi:hypothetical protein
MLNVMRSTYISFVTSTLINDQVFCLFLHMRETEIIRYIISMSFVYSLQNEQVLCAAQSDTYDDLYSI